MLSAPHFNEQYFLNHTVFAASTSAFRLIGGIKVLLHDVKNNDVYSPQIAIAPKVRFKKVWCNWCNQRELVRLILDSCEKARIQQPEFIEGADSVKLIFNFLPANKSHASQEKKLMALFSTQKEVKLSDVENCLGVSRNTATRKLNKLIESGKIRREGSGPSVRYLLG